MGRIFWGVQGENGRGEKVETSSSSAFCLTVLGSKVGSRPVFGKIDRWENRKKASSKCVKFPVFR